MESVLAGEMRGEVARLASFDRYPLDEGRQTPRTVLSHSPSPLKLASAGFYRREGLESDEVVCFSCSLRVRNWEGEPPLAVHRIRRPECKFLKQIYSTPTTARPMISFSDSSPTHNGERSYSSVRRELFPHSNPDSTDGSLGGRLGIMSILDPDLSSLAGSELMLYENQRLLTFVNPLDSLAQAWAKQGFVMDLEERELLVKCVFCGAKTSYAAGLPPVVHESISPNCPFVRYLDVGNISRVLEEKVRRKYGREAKQEDVVASVRHPQFQELEKRMETFCKWPCLLQSFVPKESLAEAGFFFTGCADKVECFSCGAGLRNWQPGADPWTQHARVSQRCLHLSQNQDRDFLRSAAGAEVLCDFDPPKEGTLSPEGETTTTSSILPQLDLEGVNAALACGYSIEHIRQALRSFLLANCGYPNKALLLGKLQASEANFILLQKQSSQIQQQQQKMEEVQQHHQQEMERTQQEMQHRHQQEMERTHQELQERESLQSALWQREQRHRQELRARRQEMEQKHVQIQALTVALESQADSNANMLEEIVCQDTELSRNRQELSRKDTELSRNRQELSRKDTELSRNRQELSRNRQELSRKDTELSRKDTELSRNRQELSRKDTELSTKTLVIQKLTELLQQQGLELPPLNIPNQERVASLGEELQLLPLSLSSTPVLPPASPPASAPAPAPAVPQAAEANSPPPLPASPSPPASPELGEGLSRDVLCKICLQEEARAVFQPCRHLCCGPRCAPRFTGHNCPVCRTHVGSWSLIFRA